MPIRHRNDCAPNPRAFLPAGDPKTQPAILRIVRIGRGRLDFFADTLTDTTEASSNDEGQLSAGLVKE